MKTLRFARAFTTLLVTFCGIAHSATVTTLQTPTTSRLQAVFILDENTIFASGVDSTVVMSNDGGDSWQQLPSPAPEGQQFRDIEVNDDTIFLMAAGEGEQSAVYTSKIGHIEWQKRLAGTIPAHFFNCLDVDDKGHLWLFGDSVDGYFYLNTSRDGGQHWKVTKALVAGEGEGGFASSGTCLNANKGTIAIGTGNGERSNLFIYDDDEWQTIATPLATGEASGVFSVQLTTEGYYAFGGTLQHQNSPAQGFFYTKQTQQWQALPKMPITGAVYGSAIADFGLLIANPQGVALLPNNTNEWTVLSHLDIWALECLSNTCWAVGANGKVLKIKQ